MAYLFTIEGKVVFPHAETLLISPFKDIWERDKSEGKEVALAELAYIEFMTSARKSNPYKGYTKATKESVVREAVITMENWQPDEFIVQAMDKIYEFQQKASVTFNFWVAAKAGAEKVQNFFLTVDMNEKGGKFNTPIWKPRDITSALNDTEKVLTNLNALEKKVEEELFESTKNKSDKLISPFADPESLKH